MSLILRQELSTVVPLPVEGKSTLFLSPDDQVSLKRADGNISKLLTADGTANTQVLFNNANVLGGSSNFTFNSTTNLLTVSGNINVGNISSGNWAGNVITVAYGGTGLSSLTSNALMVGNATGNVKFVSPGNVGNVLTSNGTNWLSTAPVLVENPAGTFTLTGNLITTGDMTVQGTLYESSDIKLKKDVQTINDALDTLNNLRGVTFNWIKNDKQSMGLIAQETEKVIPYIVQEDTLGVRSINYTALVGLLIESIKELNNKVSDLESQLTTKITTSSTIEKTPPRKTFWSKIKEKF